MALFNATQLIEKILDPWIMWSYTNGFEIDIEALFNTWLNGGLNEPWLPAPPTK